MTADQLQLGSAGKAGEKADGAGSENFHIFHIFHYHFAIRNVSKLYEFYTLSSTLSIVFYYPAFAGFQLRTRILTDSW